MSYTKRPDYVMEGGLVVQLDTGDLVFVQQEVKPLTESLCPSIYVSATWIDEQLQVMVDSKGRPTAQVEFKHTASQHQLDTLTLPVIVRECLWLVLGEFLTVVAPEQPTDPPLGTGEEIANFIALHSTTLIPWANDLVQSVDLRRAISIAKQGVEVDLEQVL